MSGSLERSTRSARVGRLRAVAIYFGLVDDPRAAAAGQPADEAREAGSVRRRLEATLIYFGLAESDDAEARAGRAARPEWDRLFFAVAVPLWASGHVDGWWYALYVALGALAGIVELIRWAAKRFTRGWLDRALALVSIWPVLALGVLVVFGDDTGAGPALLYAAACFGALYGVIEVASWWVRRREPSAPPRA